MVKCYLWFTRIFFCPLSLPQFSFFIFYNEIIRNVTLISNRNNSQHKKRRRKTLPIRLFFILAYRKRVHLLLVTTHHMNVVETLFSFLFLKNRLHVIAFHEILNQFPWKKAEKVERQCLHVYQIGPSVGNASQGTD